MKLIKNIKLNHYFLKDDTGITIGSTDFIWCIDQSSNGNPKYQLSIENCDSIFSKYNAESIV